MSLKPETKASARALAEARGVSFSELVENCLVQEVGPAYGTRNTFYEFFAGGGMAGIGLGERWKCLAANDSCEKKAASFRVNHPSSRFIDGCISQVAADELPERADLAWASFPCQDLSLAGNRAGLHAKKSGAFWPFWTLMKQLIAAGRGPRSIVMENVAGLLTTTGGEDFATICHELACEGYSTGAFVLDARHFVPQSRKRVFIVAFAPGQHGLEAISDPAADEFWHPPSMRRSVERFSSLASRHWLWLTPPRPMTQPLGLGDIIEREPKGVCWHTREQTEKLLAMMSPVNRRKIDEARRARNPVVGALYRRTRPGDGGKRVQRAEIRFDLAGCLRTPGGGSSRQILMVADRGEIRSRLISPREAARLMGLPDSYRLPSNYNEAYHLLGDGVVAPAVGFIGESVLEPVLSPACSLQAEIG